MTTQVPSRAAIATEPVAGALDRWEREGLISAELADSLREDLAAHDASDVAAPTSRAPRPAPESLLTEALSYLGGVLVLLAGGLLTTRLWDDLDLGGRALLAAATTALLLGAGLLVPRRLGPAGQRVRRALWLLSTAAFAGLLAVVTTDGLDREGAGVGMLVGGGTAVYAAALWWRERSAIQQLALFAASVGFVAATGIELLGDHQGLVPGLAVLVLAALWGVAAHRGLVTPRRPGIAAGGATALFGGLVTTGSERGAAFVLAVVVVVAVVALAVLLDELPLLGIGAVGAVFILPSAVGHFFPSVVGAAVVLLVAGVGLIASGLTIAGRRSRPG
jgi:hypothetical protein